MSIRTLLSPLAVAAILAFSGGAMGQVMINDFEIPEEDIGTFTQKCQALQAAMNQSLSEPENLDETVTGSIGADDPDPAATSNQLELLASITVDDCKAAGLL
jgi:hypothetical protein